MTGDFKHELSNQTNVDVPVSINEPYFNGMSINITDTENNTIQSTESQTIMTTCSFDPSSLEEGHYNLVISVTDKSGNRNQVVEHMYIDRTKPLINITSPDNNGIDAGTIHIEAIIIEENELNEYKLSSTIDSGEEVLLQSGNESDINIDWDSRSVPVDLFHLTLRFCATDKAGNEYEETRSLTVYNRKPQVAVQCNSIHYIENTNYYVNGENLMELSASTDQQYSAVKNIYYCYSPIYQDMQTYTDPITLPGGCYELRFYAEDVLGNQSDISIVIIDVDTTPPRLSSTIRETHYITDSVTYISSNNTIVIYCYEDGSPGTGIASLEYRVDDGEWISQEELYQNQRLYIRLADEGLADITIRAEDRVSNVSELIPGTFNVDNTAPVTQMNTSRPLTGGPGNYSAETGLVCNWVASDSSSGIGETAVTINGEPLPGDELRYTFTGEGTYSIEYYSIDNVGNSEESNSIVVEIKKPETLLGDVDSDGAITIVDALLVAQYYVGIDPANFNPDAGDVDCNGSIDIIDALLIAQYYVGLISNFCMQ
ncbi:MAG: dockerin type I repeat-containing protein [Spirochaetales bacterium]|nr:dockerin type I repeat-containing protein [Spirochaetales bacterium]